LHQHAAADIRVPRPRDSSTIEILELAVAQPFDPALVLDLGIRLVQAGRRDAPESLHQA
jgi:hypothetical protein